MLARILLALLLVLALARTGLASDTPLTLVPHQEVDRAKVVRRPAAQPSNSETGSPDTTSNRPWSVS